jgi:hypothetical protein
LVEFVIKTKNSSGKVEKDFFRTKAYNKTACLSGLIVVHPRGLRQAQPPKRFILKQWSEFCFVAFGKKNPTLERGFEFNHK